MTFARFAKTLAMYASVIQQFAPKNVIVVRLFRCRVQHVVMPYRKMTRTQ
jgi:hypothetical protein